MRLSYAILISLMMCAFTSADNYIYNNYRFIKNISFDRGEEITYRAHYGFINAAEGKMVIGDKLYRLNDRICYKIDVYGNSVGMFDLFLRIRDNWGTYLDTASIISHKFYRKIEEGKYRKHEITDFDHDNKIAKVRNYDRKKKIWKPTETYEIPSNIQDLVSGYYYVRTLDFDTLENDEIITVDAFFDDEVYNFEVRYLGKDRVKTKLGKINALVLSPIMPENSLFDGENSIRVWISDDINKVPLKIKAQMFVGSVEIDITSFKKGDVK